MTRSDMQRVVDRLWALCDGAGPAVDVCGKRAFGICYDIGASCGIGINEALGEHIRQCCGFNSLFAFESNDWGNDRRCLAGVLAGYIEGLMEEMQ